MKDVEYLNDSNLVSRARTVARATDDEAAKKVILELAGRLALRTVVVRDVLQGIMIVDLHNNSRFLTPWESFLFRVFGRLPKGLTLHTEFPNWNIL